MHEGTIKIRKEIK